MEYKNCGKPTIIHKNTLYNCDCMDLLKETPDKYYELAIVDPPYGIGEDGRKTQSRVFPTEKWKNPVAKPYKLGNWDNETPSQKYFEELKRVSKNQIIWGGNHFISKIPFDSSCWIVWDKLNGDTDFADCELAYTSFKTAVRKFSFLWAGFKKGEPENRIHPTQKPVALYKWLLKNYAKEGDKILDTHLGSMSIAIACHYMGFELTGCELDKEYFDAGVERVTNQTRQETLL